MKIVLGCDHGAVDLKNGIAAHLRERGFEVDNFGIESGEAIDYPEMAKKVCDTVVMGDADLAILCCGTGIGMSMAANKIKGIRAACCSDTFSAKYTRLHNDANVLCLGGRVVGLGLALEMVDLFVDTEFEGGRHKRRVDLITALEK